MYSLPNWTPFTTTELNNPTLIRQAHTRPYSPTQSLFRADRLKSLFFTYGHEIAQLGTESSSWRKGTAVGRYHFRTDPTKCLYLWISLQTTNGDDCATALCTTLTAMVVWLPSHTMQWKTWMKLFLHVSLLLARGHQLPCWLLLACNLLSIVVPTSKLIMKGSTPPKGLQSRSRLLYLKMPSDY